MDDTEIECEGVNETASELWGVLFEADMSLG